MAEEKKEVKAVKRPTAQKRQIQDSKRRLRNKSFRTKVRSTIKQYRENIEKGVTEGQKEKLSEIYSLMDKGVNKAVFKRNQANRLKTRLTSALQPKAQAVKT